VEATGVTIALHAAGKRAEEIQKDLEQEARRLARTVARTPRRSLVRLVLAVRLRLAPRTTDRRPAIGTVLDPLGRVLHAARACHRFRV